MRRLTPYIVAPIIAALLGTIVVLSIAVVSKPPEPPKLTLAGKIAATLKEVPGKRGIAYYATPTNGPIAGAVADAAATLKMTSKALSDLGISKKDIQYFKRECALYTSTGGEDYLAKEGVVYCVSTKVSAKQAQAALKPRGSAIGVPAA